MQDGAVLSIFKAQRLLGLCRYILEDPLYEVLLFPKPFIERSEVVSIKIGEVDAKDAKNTIGARLILNVTVNEQNSFIAPIQIASNNTNVALIPQNLIYTQTF